MALAQIQMDQMVKYSIVSVDFIPFLICCEVLFLGCVTALQFIRTIYIAVQSCDPIVTMESRVGRSYCDHMQYELCELRLTADRLHCDRKVAVRNFEHSKIPH